MTYYYDPYEQYSYSYNMNIEKQAVWIIMLVLAGLFVWVIFSIVSYVLKGIGLYTIAKREGREYPGLAFVPFARTYLKGEVSGEITLKTKKILHPGVWLLILPIIYSVCYMILYFPLVAVLMYVGESAESASRHGMAPSLLPIIVIFVLLILLAILFQAVIKTLQILVMGQIYERFTTRSMAVVHGVLGSFIPMYESICLFILRNRPYNPGMEPLEFYPFPERPEGPGDPDPRPPYWQSHWDGPEGHPAPPREDKPIGYPMPDRPVPPHRERPADSPAVKTVPEEADTAYAAPSQEEGEDFGE